MIDENPIDSNKLNDVIFGEIGASKVLVSIITVVYNAADKLGETIESVIPHLGSDVEYIVVDGASIDGTVDVIKKYQRFINIWVSEKDAGIYDAMNKGASLARGEFVYNLNVGDRLIELPRDDLINKSLDIHCVAFAVNLSNGVKFLPSWDVRLKFFNTVHHQGAFYRRLSVPLYSLKYAVFSDFDLNQRIKNINGQAHISNKIVAFHDTGGLSNMTNRFFEIYEIINSNNGKFWVIISYIFFKIRGVKKRLGF